MRLGRVFQGKTLADFNPENAPLDRREQARTSGAHVFGRPGIMPAEPSSAGPDFARSLRGASPTDLMEVRLLLEPQVAAMAATRATAEDMNSIETALRHSVGAKGVAEFEHWDAALHLAIFRAARNPILLAWCEAINALRNEPNWYQLKKRSLTQDLRNQYDREHADIVTALRDRDSMLARERLTKHLTRVRDSLLGVG